MSVANDVRSWAIMNGSSPSLRIALCGYAEEHDELGGMGWSVYRWSARASFPAKNGNNQNRFREAIWFSPYCLNPSEILLHEDEMPNGLHWEIQAAP